MTTLGKLTLAVIIIFCIWLTWMIDGATIDMDSLRLSCPVGDCAGGEVPEMKKSVYKCNDLVKYLKIGQYYKYYEEEKNPYKNDRLVFKVIERSGNYCQYWTYYKGHSYFESGMCYIFNGMYEYEEVKNPEPFYKATEPKQSVCSFCKGGVK